MLARSADPAGVAFFVPGEPTSKGRPRFVRGTGRTYTPAKTVKGERNIASFALEAMAGRPLYDVPVELFLIATYLPPKSRTRKAAALPGAAFKGTRVDLDNTLKAYADAMNGVVYVDDALIAAVHVAKVYGERPGVTVRVRPCTPFCWPLSEGDAVVLPERLLEPLDDYARRTATTRAVAVAEAVGAYLGLGE